MRVEDVMTQGVRTVTVDRSLKEVAMMLADLRIGGMPVVDAEGAPLGVISKADIVLKEGAELPSPGWRRIFGRGRDDATAAKITAHTAGDAMTSPAITIGPEVPVSIACERMVAEGVNRMPVVRRDRVVGILTRHDLVCLFARSDAELEREIREDLLSDLTWPEAIAVRVQDGEVTLRGQADTLLDAETVPARVRRVLGVVSVDSELSAWDAPAERQIKVTAHV
jgi:CBS domain-containing protein